MQPLWEEKNPSLPLRQLFEKELEGENVRLNSPSQGVVWLLLSQSWFYRVSTCPYQCHAFRASLWFLEDGPFVLDYDLTFVDNDSHLKSGLSYHVVFWEPTVAQKKGLRGQQHSSAFVVPVKGADRHKINIHLPAFHTAFGCTVSPGKEPMLFWQKQPLSSLFKVSDVGKLELKARTSGKPKWNRSLQCFGNSREDCCANRWQQAMSSSSNYPTEKNHDLLQ